MREFNIHFYTNNPCNIFVNGEMLGLIDNKSNFFIDIVSFTDQMVITCEPICEDNTILLPYSFKLNYINNTLQSSSSNTTIVPFPNNNYDVILDFKMVMVNNKSTLLSKKIDNYTILTMVDTISTLSIFLDNKNLYTCKYANLCNLEYEKYKDLLIITGDSNQSKLLICYDTIDNKILLSDTYSNIEKNKDYIKALKCPNLTLLTGTVYSLNLSNKEIENYQVYLDNYKATTHPSLIPYSFLEAVQNQNYKLAEDYIDKNLIQADETKLKQYFGDINKIYYNCYNLDKNKVNYTIYTDKYHNYNFYINQDKIIEIEENQLN